MERRIPVKLVKARIRIGNIYRICKLTEDKDNTYLAMYRGKICLYATVWKNDIGYPGKGKKRIRISPENYGLGSNQGFYDKDIIQFKYNGETFTGKLSFRIEELIAGSNPWIIQTYDGREFPLKGVSYPSYVGSELSGDILSDFPSNNASKVDPPKKEALSEVKNEPLQEEMDFSEAECATEESTPQIEAEGPKGKHYVIYTDGSALSNPGPCGGAYLMIVDGIPVGQKLIPIGQGTNNIAEIRAVTEAVRDCKSFSPGKITVLSDSQYVIKGITEWSGNWKANGWKTSSGQPVANHELWEELLKEIEGIDIDFQWVKGHDCDRYNDMVDKLAKKAAAESVNM